ncbi:hypothetical protein GL213_14150 [Halogeometricum borinquense]|nr:hypothetical protein GL213_14150 [Halogeometricum borinquense]
MRIYSADAQNEESNTGRYSKRFSESNKEIDDEPSRRTEMRIYSADAQNEESNTGRYSKRFSESNNGESRAVWSRFSRP